MWWRWNIHWWLYNLMLADVSSGKDIKFFSQTFFSSYFINIICNGNILYWKTCRIENRYFIPFSNFLFPDDYLTNCSKYILFFITPFFNGTFISPEWDACSHSSITIFDDFRTIGSNSSFPSASAPIKLMCIPSLSHSAFTIGRFFLWEYLKLNYTCAHTWGTSIWMVWFWTSRAHTWIFVAWACSQSSAHWRKWDDIVKVLYLVTKAID